MNKNVFQQTSNHLCVLTVLNAARLNLQLLHLLTANITSQISKIQQRLTPLVVPVLHDIENLTGMTSDHSLFQGVLVDALDPGIGAIDRFGPWRFPGHSRLQLI